MKNVMNSWLHAWLRTALIITAAGLGIFLVASVCLAGMTWDSDGVCVNKSGYSQFDKKVVPDGSGGAIVSWMEYRSGGIAMFVQRIGAGGNRLWGSNGKSLGSFEYLYGSDIAPDGSGGAILVWSDYIESEFRHMTYAQRFNGNGAPVWPSGGIPVCTADGSKIMPKLAPDGTGGAVVSWVDTRAPSGDYNIYAQRFDSSGNYLWNAAGLAVCTAAGSQQDPELTSGGDGGAVISWLDDRSGSRTDLYAQKVDSAGAIVWTPDGLNVCDSAGEKEDYSLAGDGSGGAIITWEDSRGDFWNVYSQRIGAGGAVRWTDNGVRVCKAEGNQLGPRLVGDGSGGALFAWNDQRSGTSKVFAQHLDAGGAPAPGWSAAGNLVSSFPDATAAPTITADGSGGALISFVTGRDYYPVIVAGRKADNRISGQILVQNMLADGNVAPGWPDEGDPVTVTPRNQNQPVIIPPNGAGGAIVVWNDIDRQSLYAQKINTSASTWYLAEGSTAWGYETYVSIENPNSTAVTAEITYMTPEGQLTPQVVELPAASQTTVSPDTFLGYGTDFSMKVKCPQDVPIAVDRTMYWTGTGAPSCEAHSSVGVNNPARTWYMPEGSSAWGFECWLLVQNPNGSDATCSITYMIEGERPHTVDKIVPANSRRSFNMADDIGAWDASIMVDSDLPVVPERSMYRDNRREGHESIGTTSTSTDYYLAEGTTAWGFTTYVLIQNPNAEPALVTLNFNTPVGRVSTDPFSMPSYSRKTVRLNDLLSATDVSTWVNSDQPIIAERAMYWGEGTPLGEATHDSIGLPDAHGVFYLPDGQTSEGRETFTLVQNPNDTPVKVRVTYLTPDGAENVTFLDDIPAFGRRTFNMEDELSDGRAAVMVECRSAGKKIMVERAMYWNNRGAGTCTIGGYSN